VAARHYAFDLLLALGAAGAVLAGCARCDRSRPPLPGPDAAREDAGPVLPTDAAADAEAPAPPPLDAGRVKAAYQALIAGDLQTARTAFRALGRFVGPTSATRLARDAFLLPGGQRALLDLGATCAFDDVGVERCAAVTDRSGGTCSGGRLRAGCGRVLVDLIDGRARAFFGPGEAAGVGRYLITYTAKGSSVVNRLDTLEEILTVDGEIVSAVAGGSKLVAIRTAPGRGAGYDVVVVDPERRTTSPPCRVRRATTMSRAAIRFRYLAASDRLLIESGSPYSDITLCAVDSGRTLASFATKGSTTAIIDAPEKSLYVSGEVVATATPQDSLGGGPEAAALVDHYAVNLATGAAQRVRTKEHTTDLPGRDMVLSTDGATLVVATHALLRFFSTRPFRVLSDITLDVPVLDSSYNVTPALTILPDGKTLLARYDVAALAGLGSLDDAGAAAAASSFEVWVVSTASRSVLYRGRSVLGWRSDPAGRRGAIVLDATRPASERLVLSVTETGLVSRVLGPGEGDARGETLPPELGAATPPALLPDPAALQGLAVTMCAAAGGMPVPRALCESK